MIIEQFLTELTGKNDGVPVRKSIAKSPLRGVCTVNEIYSFVFQASARIRATLCKRKMRTAQVLQRAREREDRNAIRDPFCPFHRPHASVVYRLLRTPFTSSG